MPENQGRLFGDDNDGALVTGCDGTMGGVGTGCDGTVGGVGTGCVGTTGGVGTGCDGLGCPGMTGCPGGTICPGGTVGPGGIVFPGGVGAGFAGGMTAEPAGPDTDATFCAGRFKTTIMLMTASDRSVCIFLFFIN
jgi:hypothetical protein